MIHETKAEIIKHFCKGYMHARKTKKTRIGAKVTKKYHTPQ